MVVYTITRVLSFFCLHFKHSIPVNFFKSSKVQTNRSIALNDVKGVAQYYVNSILVVRVVELHLGEFRDKSECQ